ncbi:calcineurin-like phosphoesterase C-terminal domain-containing protein [Sediminibacterium ginsengisoli]|uniref:Calcineurin-like phosphoesterase n=1 Tax=Sediminibacterium ginsengisoli TaxID=413434 RepID=A0A1T4M3I9_9BACT|nr:calcineurin-like phosphoesterase family protein [Sediminibacterium ginsengisoli]SJZ61455.1 Calcineurin-like phosphoesterase [Sediminibacterium ginsengisoli]
MQRRIFLKNVLMFTGGGLLASCARPFSGSKSRSGNAITGRITSNGKPLANVIVSDCYNAVATDKNGNYSIEPHANATFVFVSTPAGYHFPNEASLARQYKTISSLTDKKADFEFQPIGKDDSNHKFIIWADPQVKNDKDVKLMMNESVPDVQKLVGGLAAGTLIHGICVGDIVWDNHDLFPRYNEAVSKMGIPFFQAIGNHDMDYRLGGDETSDATFKKHYGPTNYSFNRGKAHYVVLDDVLYLGKEREYKGSITQAQLDWLKKDLEFVPKDNLVIICLHIPVHNAVDNNKDLYAILEPFKNCHIMSGHTHYNRNVITNGIYEHVHGTVCGAWWTGPICEDGTPDGYGVYEVKGNELSWYYKSTGQQASHQISLFVQKNEAGQDEMIANVFNWDPLWKVEWWLDGQSKGVLGNKPGFDPLAVKLMKGDKLPASRSFAEPKKTDHIFSVPLPAGYKSIKVQATDRFGNKYEATA